MGTCCTMPLKRTFWPRGPRDQRTKLQGATEQLRENEKQFRRDLSDLQKLPLAADVQNDVAQERAVVEDYLHVAESTAQPGNGSRSHLPKEFMAAFDRVRVSMARMTGRLEEDGKRCADNSTRAVAMSYYLMGAALVLSIAFAVYAAAMIMRSLIRIFRELADCAKAIADGDLTTTDICVRTDDELGALTQAINDMKRRLRDMVVSLAQAHKLEAIGQLAAGIAHEINTPIQFVADNTTFLKDSWSSIVGLLNFYQTMHQEVVERGAVSSEACTKLDELCQHSDLDYVLEEVPSAIEQSLEGLQRVAKIVRAMKEFSHPGTQEKSSIDINRDIETT